MKKWTGFLVTLAVLIFAAYYVMGYIVENSLNKSINSIPQNPILSVHLDNYQRGWFSSQAVLAIKMDIPKQQSISKNGQPQEVPAVVADLSFPLTINHGPFICTDSGIRFGMGHVTTHPQTHYQAFVSYFNNILLRYTFPSFSFQSKIGPQDFQFTMQGVQALLSSSPAADKINGNLMLFGFNGHVDKTTFKLGEVLNDFKFDIQDGLWLGQTHYLVSSADLSMENKKMFDLEAFDLVFGSNVSDGGLNYTFDLSLKKLFVNDKTYAPGVLKLSIKNLDPKAVAKIGQQQWKMLQDNSNLPMLAILAELPNLLAKGAELDLSEFNLNVPEGTITGNLKISLPKEGITEPSQMLQKANGEGQFKAPIAAVKALMVASIENSLQTQAEKNAQTQPTTRDSAALMMPQSSVTAAPINYNAEAQKQTDQILQTFVNKEFLKVEGTDYVVHFKLENQQFIVNGKPVDSSMLK